MPSYYFRLRTGDVVVEDEEGAFHPDLRAARTYAVMAARELLAAAIRYGEDIAPDCVIVVDEQGREVLTVFLTEVLPNSIRKRLG
jgi:hypothetical protein